MKSHKPIKSVLGIILLTGLLGLISADTHSEDSTKNLTVKYEYQDIQKVCAKAVEEPLNREDISGLRECISRLDDFIFSYRSTSLARDIKAGLPIVPKVDWFEEVIPISKGEYFIDGRLNNEPISVVIRPKARKARISQELATNLNLEWGIKIRVEEGSVKKEYFTTSINDLRINSLHFQNLVALIDVTLEIDQLAIGSNVLDGLMVEDLGNSLVISGGVIQEGSEAELAISFPVITNLLDQLISDLMVSFEKRMSKTKRTFQLASGIDDIDEYQMKLGLLADVQKEVGETLEAYPEIHESQRFKIETFLDKVQSLIDETTKKRENFSERLCKQVAEASSLISTADEISILIDELEGAYATLIRLEEHFAGTEVVAQLMSSQNHCGSSPKQFGKELDVAGLYLQAIACADKGLLTFNYLDRENAYDCALQAFKDIEMQSEESTLAARVKNSSEIDNFTKDKLKELIEIEDEAQDKLANVGELREEATDEDRLPRRYEILTAVLKELEAVQQLGAAVDPEYLKLNIQEIRSELTDLERTMPLEPELVHVDGGCFTIGAIAGDVDAADDEAQQEICVEKFQIGIYEVTFAEFDRYSYLESRRLVDDRGWGRGSRPVINVSYMEAIAYAKWLSYHTDHSYRLPTEAEWEYAARGGRETIFPWGDRVGRRKANCRNCRSQWAGKQTAPVGSFEPNGYGIYDMAGNVAERTCSIYRTSYDGSERLCQPLEKAGDRTVRGGSWKSHSRNIRTSYRYAATEIDKKSRFRGFRLVQELQ